MRESYKCVDEGFGGLRNEGRTDAAKFPEMKEGSLGNVFNVVFEGEGLVKDDAKVAEVEESFVRVDDYFSFSAIKLDGIVDLLCLM